MRAQTITSIQHARIARFTVAVVALVVALGGLSASARAETTGNTVTEWNAIAASATIATAGQPPHVAPLSLGMVHGAMYDAVNAIDGGHQPYLIAPAAEPSDSKKAAAATAAYRVLVGLFPTQQPTLKPRYDASLEAVPDGPAKAGGIAVGEEAAATMLAARQNDGRGGPFTVVEGTEPGEWRKTPPNFGGDPAPWVGNVRPFLVPNVEMLRSEGPNALKSAAYAEDYNEVKELGSLTSTRRTADQTAASIFWQDSGPAIWNRVFRQLAASEELDIVESARMFAMTNLASADGVIGCWNDKYYWNFWRPMTAIREGADDGNPATEADPGWKPLFDPSVPVSGAAAGHAGVPGPPVGARLPQRGHRADAEGVLRHGQDRVHGGEQQVLSRALSAEELRPLLDAIKEVIDARVWSGIHFRTADVQGAVLGKKVGS